MKAQESISLDTETWGNQEFMRLSLQDILYWVRKLINNPHGKSEVQVIWKLMNV